MMFQFSLPGPDWVWLVLPIVVFFLFLRAVKIWLRTKLLEILMKIVTEGTKKGIFTQTQQKFVTDKLIEILNLQNKLISKGL